MAALSLFFIEGRKVRAAMGTAPCEKWGIHTGDCVITDSVAEI